MGFRCQFLCKADITWPDWFRDKYRIYSVPKFGSFGSTGETVKIYCEPFMYIEGDLQTAFKNSEHQDEYDPPIQLLKFFECGGVTISHIHADKIEYFDLLRKTVNDKWPNHHYCDTC